MIYINLLPETEKRSYGELRERKREVHAAYHGGRRGGEGESCYTKIWGREEERETRNVGLPLSGRAFAKIKARPQVRRTPGEISFWTDARERKRINTRQVLLLLGRRFRRAAVLPSPPLRPFAPVRTRLISLVVLLDYAATTNE